MNKMREALAEALAAPEAPSVNVVFSSSMESTKIDVLSMESFGFNELSMETQQMEDHLTKLVDHKIEQILQPVPKPTAPTAFVVSRKGLTDGVISDQEVVRAAVQAKLEEPNDDIVLAVLPEEATTGSEEPDEHVESIRQFAAGADVPVVESMEALQAYLENTKQTKENIEKVVKRRLSKISGEASEDLPLSARLREDCGLDEIDIVDLAMDLEEVFDVEFRSDAKNLRTINDLVKQVSK